MAKKNADRLAKYEATIPPRIIDKWEKCIAIWDKTRDMKHAECPYLEPIRSTYAHCIVVSLPNTFSCSAVSR